MLRSMKDLEGYAIRATDGTIGHVKDFYFDDAAWAIRYLVVDTGTWLASRKVLISPIAIGHPDWAEKTLPVSITREQVKNSPDIDTEKPVSRQHELGYLAYYGYQDYWGGDGLWGEMSYPGMLLPGFAGAGSAPHAVPPDAAAVSARAEAARHPKGDPHLRSCKEVMGYDIHASDGDIGHVQGMLVDEETWAIRYLVVETGNWWLGHRVLVAPQWIQKVSWSSTTVSVNLTRQAVKDAPPYDTAAELDREREMDLHEHYGRPAYWAAEGKRAAAPPSERHLGR
jgi:uncharacterized protein YrrD